MKIHSAIAMLVLLVSCNSPTPVKEKEKDLRMIQQMEWVLGSWEALSPEGDMFESWTRIDDSTFAGQTCGVVKGDTVFSEAIRLELRQNELIYSSAVSDQNNGQPVPFTLTNSENGEMTFSNEKHDFPQRIIYKNNPPDSVYIRIEGNDKGTFRKEMFPMRRKGK